MEIVVHYEPSFSDSSTTKKKKSEDSLTLTENVQNFLKLKSYTLERATFTLEV